MRRILPILAIVVLSTAAFAQAPARMGRGAGPMAGPGMGVRGGAEFREHLFPPQMILRHQTELGITDAQIETLKKLINESHAKTMDLQIDLQRVTERLEKIVETTRVDEAAALAASDEAMALESQIKKAHLALLVRVKNLLTPEQVEKAKGLRDRPDRADRPDRPGPGPDRVD